MLISLLGFIWEEGGQLFDCLAFYLLFFISVEACGFSLVMVSMNLVAPRHVGS